MWGIRMQLARVVTALALAVSLGASAAPMPVHADGILPPVANDDPAVPGCNRDGGFGGSTVIPEDWIGFEPSRPGWYPMFGGCWPLANDTDPYGLPLTAELVGQPAHGQAIVLNEYQFMY